MKINKLEISVRLPIAAFADSIRKFSAGNTIGSRTEVLKVTP